MLKTTFKTCENLKIMRKLFLVVFKTRQTKVFVGGCSTADVEVLKGVFMESGAPAIVNAKVC